MNIFKLFSTALAFLPLFFFSVSAMAERTAAEIRLLNHVANLMSRQELQRQLTPGFNTSVVMGGGNPPNKVSEPLLLLPQLHPDTSSPRVGTIPLNGN